MSERLLLSYPFRSKVFTALQAHESEGGGERLEQRHSAPLHQL